MGRAINLRQIEIFKAFVEQGTVSRAAEAVYISQPAASKLLVQLEQDHGLKLFDRNKGRLTPTAQGLRLYEEVSRIFVGVRQVETAIGIIKREDQGRLAVGVIPALAGAFIQRTTMSFLRRNPNVYLQIKSPSSQWIADYVLTRQLDLGILAARMENLSIATERVLRYPLLCIMPKGHSLSSLQVVHPENLNNVPFVSFDLDSYTGQKVAEMFDTNAVRSNIVMTADASLTLCQFVAAGLGVSLVHPLFVAGLEGLITARPFEPEISADFLLCFARDARNLRLISEFAADISAVAAVLVEDLKRGWAE